MTSSPHESRLTRRTFVGTVATIGAAVAAGVATAGTASAAPAKLDRAVGVARIGSTVHTLGRADGAWLLVAANGTSRATTGLDGADLYDMTGANGGAVAVGAVLDGDRSIPTVWESGDGLAWRAVTSLSGLDGHLSAVAVHGNTAMAVGSLLTLERAPRQRLALRRDQSGWSVAPLDGLEHTDEWAASAIAGGADGWILSTVDASGSVLASSPDGLNWTAGTQLVDAAVRSLAFTSAGVRWVGNAIGGSGAVTGVVDAGRHPVPVPLEAQGLGAVGDQSYWLVDGRIVSATV
jgi:hypothetical protein